MSAKNEIGVMKKQYRNSLKLCSLFSLSAAVLASALCFMSIQTPSVNYYATTREGLNIPMIPLSTALVSTDYVLQWVSIAARQALNLNFSNLEKELAAVQPDFTSNGYSAFTDSLKSSGLYASVVKKHLIINVVAGKPIVSGTGVYEGHFYWDIHVPLLETVQSASTSVPRHLAANIRVLRVSSLDSTQGIQIDRFVLQHLN